MVKKYAVQDFFFIIGLIFWRTGVKKELITYEVKLVFYSWLGLEFLISGKTTPLLNIYKMLIFYRIYLVQYYSEEKTFFLTLFFSGQVILILFQGKNIFSSPVFVKASHCLVFSYRYSIK